MYRGTRGRNKNDLFMNKTKNSREFVTHEFPAVFDRGSCVLLLGSIPSPKSREEGFYYGHPQNRFWKVLATVLGESVPATIPQKKAMLKKHHVALWDVLESCTIVGASDTSIEDAVPNRIGDLVKKSKVSAPEILIDDQMRALKDDVTRNAMSMGVSFEDYIKRAGETPESWEKKAREVSEQRVKGSLVLQNLALAEKITVSDDIVAAKIAELKDVYKKSPEALKSLKDPNVKMDIRNRMMIEKTLDYLVKVNK